MNVIADDIDLSHYLRAAEDLRILVKPASAYADELRAEFAHREAHQQVPTMFSTKLRERLEFRPGEVTVWAGYNGHRKSMLTGQLALDMLAQRQAVLMASFEMAPARTLGRMIRQAWATERPTSDEQAKFLVWADSLSIFDHKGTISPERCTAVCRYFAEEHGGQQVFIDSMMMVCASEEHLDEQKQFVTGVVRMAIETGLHVHVIAHCRKPQDEGKPPSKYDLRGSAAISDQADNVVTVWANQAKKASGLSDRMQPDAAVTVEKQRNGKWEGRAHLWFHEASLRFTDEPQEHVDAYSGLYRAEVRL